MNRVQGVFSIHPDFTLGKAHHAQGRFVFNKIKPWDKIEEYLVSRVYRVSSCSWHGSIFRANKLSICGEGYIVEDYAAMVVGVLLSVVRM